MQNHIRLNFAVKQVLYVSVCCHSKTLNFVVLNNLLLGRGTNVWLIPERTDAWTHGMGSHKEPSCPPCCLSSTGKCWERAAGDLEWHSRGCYWILLEDKLSTAIHRTFYQVQLRAKLHLTIFRVSVQVQVEQQN